MKTHRVAVLALNHVIPLDLALPVEVFSHPPYRTQVCAPTSPVRTTAGFTINPDRGLRALARADTVVVPGYRPHDVSLDPAVLAALRRAHARGARMISICVGAFALAQAGILDGRPAATHWRNTDELAQQFPAIDVRADVLYVDDGDVLTSAGVSSGLDLCLHVVRTDLGVEEARRIAQELVAAPHRDGNQAQFIARPLEVAGTGPIGELCAWAKENLDQQITLEDLAARCAMSPRTLTRHFRDATGTTPLQWLLTMRIDEARRLLETTDLPIDDVAERAGFGTGLNLRTHFRRRLDTAPTTYRRNFRAPGGAVQHAAV
ncbi:GlxA family transcriptional regulator [Mycobacterium sp.]|uniref:GlxA family transcriptional regulator n=1 Tax=Mycobacterium sp. TaxID=1785 RepID=UPI002B6C9EB6|nr:helix-turn-helix domain-containing protein [Mycobacterium sp.]HKP39891.1 helix-turn-helix domain-containing protein [Mycobacterium sp.]